MKAKLAALGLCLGLAVGCTSQKPQPFTQTSKPLAEQMLVEVGKKNLKEIDRIMALADTRLGKSLTKNEYNVLQAAKEFVLKDEVDKAKQILNDSLKMSK